MSVTGKKFVLALYGGQRLATLDEYRYYAYNRNIASVTGTCTLTRQGCTVEPQHRLLLMWARALTIASCHVTYVCTKGGKPDIYSSAGDRMVSFIVSVPRGKSML